MIVGVKYPAPICFYWWGSNPVLTAELLEQRLICLSFSHSDDCAGRTDSGPLSYLHLSLGAAAPQPGRAQLWLSARTWWWQNWPQTQSGSSTFWATPLLLTLIIQDVLQYFPGRYSPCNQQEFDRAEQRARGGGRGGGDCWNAPQTPNLTWPCCQSWVPAPLSGPKHDGPPPTTNTEHRLTTLDSPHCV